MSRSLVMLPPLMLLLHGNVAVAVAVIVVVTVAVTCYMKCSGWQFFSWAFGYYCLHAGMNVWHALL